MRSLKPLSNKVLVERLVSDDRTPGGIVLPDSAKEKPKRGIVRAVGPGRISDDGTKVSMTVKIGQEVLFTTYAGTEVQSNGKDMIIMDETDILAIVE